jgi:glyoxylase-like metal-dependent hydrolase (beta-lactamase superfamily II)
MIIEKIIVGEFQSNCYILGTEKKRAIIIDPGAEYQKIKIQLDKHKLKPTFVINTHGHIDHIGCDNEFCLPVYIHREDKDFLFSPDKNLSNIFSSPFILKCEVRTLEDKEILSLDEISLEVIHTPGHTPGSICLYLVLPSLMNQYPTCAAGQEEDILFTGDTLFKNGIGRTDFPGADQRQLLDSMRKILLRFSDRTKILPGHGPQSYLGEEKRQNPFLCEI